MRKNSAVVYALCGILAVSAFVGTWGHNIAYLHLGFVGANVQFWRDTLVNPASRSITIDLFALVLPVAYWMFLEARRLALRGIWLYVLASLLIAVSVAFPVFLIHRERVLARGGVADEQARLSTGDRVGMLVLTLLTLAYLGLSFAGRA
ncbi:MAG: DUF2834 domain-containing protein [Myxococcales bacterium]